MLLDAETFDLVQHIDTVLAAVAGHELEPRINPELMQSVLEIATPVCHTPADVDARAAPAARATSTGIAREQGLRVGSAGTHPFSLFERQRITARDRYRHLVDQLQYVARRELIFGMHVHVAVDDPEKAIQVVNGLLAAPAAAARALGELAVLARRADRASRRAGRWSSPPSRARARRRASATTPTTRRSSASSSGPAASPTTRTSGGTSGLHPRLGTIEMRICDAVTRVEDAVAIAAYCQALVKLYCEQFDARRGDPVLPPHPHRPRTSGSPRATGSRRR